MPIQYVCLGCGQEQLLPDAKSGTLCSCNRCKLKFVAPPPNVSLVPIAGSPGRPSPVPPSGQRPPPGRPQPAPPAAQTRPAAPARPPATTAEGRPPLYPLDESTTGSGVRRPPPGLPARTGTPPAGSPRNPPPAPKRLDETNDGIFGSKTSEGQKLFGEDADEVEVGELFASAIPGQPEGDDELDVPLDGGPASFEDEETAREAPSPKAATGEAGSLISMDELFKAPPGATRSAPPAFGAGPLPTPFLKPVAPPAPAAAPAASPSQGGCGPFQLIPVEGLPDGVFSLGGGGHYLLGRDKDAEVKILSNSVSRKHARIDGTGRDAVLIDLGSANGTQVNGTSVNRHPLKDGDLIKMGKVVLRFKR